LYLRVRTAARERQRLVEFVDPRNAVRRTCTARRLRLLAVARTATDDRPCAFPQARVHRRADHGVLAVCCGLLDVPVPDAVPAELPGVLADSDRTAVPPDHALVVRVRCDFGKVVELRSAEASACGGPRVVRHRAIRPAWPLHELQLDRVAAGI